MLLNTGFAQNMKPMTDDFPRQIFFPND